MKHELLIDMHEFSMADGYYQTPPRDKQARFDVFYRKAPNDGSFVTSTGLIQAIDEIKDWHFSTGDIAHLRSLSHFSDDLLFYLTSAHDRYSIRAIPEDVPVFPQGPTLSISDSLVDIQLLETLILNITSHQSLTTTKTWQTASITDGCPVMEFDTRRTQGPGIAIYGAQTAIIGGYSSTSNVLAAKLFNLPATGVMTHAWVESFSDELTIFRVWTGTYPGNTALLVDTYGVVNSGVSNATRIFKELRATGYEPVGIRIDSGDIAQLAAKTRKMIDKVGFTNARITASNTLDIYIVKPLLDKGAPLDSFGTSERLITNSSNLALSAAYKMSALENNGKQVPKIKISNNHEKIMLPGSEQVYRLYDKYNPQHTIADVVALASEQIGTEIVAVNADVHVTRNKVILTGFIAKSLLKRVLTLKKAAPIEADTLAIQHFAQAELAQLPAATERLLNPGRFPVCLIKRSADLQ